MVTVRQNLSKNVPICSGKQGEYKAANNLWRVKKGSVFFWVILENKIKKGVH